MNRRAWNAGGKPRQPCHFFQTNGGCRKGLKCTFSHETTANVRGPKGHQVVGVFQTRDGNQRGSDNVADGNMAKLREWKRILNLGFLHARALNEAVVSRFFELGLELMDGDMGASQEAVKLLAGDAGLNFVKAITDQHVPQAATDAAKFSLWETQVSPYFSLLTHQRLVDSNVLEQEVATIYAFLVGRNAERVVKLFDFVLDLAYALSREAEQTTPVINVLELALAVLSKAIDISTTNIVNEDFHGVVERLDDLVQTSTQLQDDFLGLQAKKYLSYLRRRLGVGKDIQRFVEAQNITIKQEQFVLRRDPPGLLSLQGPRHDNDHAEISKIRIMPTYDEITASRSEYLPTTDSTQWHLPGIRGRLDREFRLLREDTIGQLREAIHAMLERIRNPGQKENRQARNSARTTAYHDAMVETVIVDKHKGLELTVRCQQPEAARQMGDRARRDWWSTSKRLQSGALACVLNAAGNVQFYVVADTTLRTDRDKGLKYKKPAQQYEELGPTDGVPLSLSYSHEYLYVRLNLVDDSRAELGRALRWYKDVGSSPRRYLVEFPGVLLPSFKHTLEALQKFSLKPDLPFSDLIAPETVTAGSEARVPPPLFARAPGFEYDLACLTRGTYSGLSVSLGRQPEVTEVSSKTGLDPTQSEALLRTLSRELSLIQGPPGTGKSYTGEKIIQVLLANREKAKLGPIICVCYTNHALDQLLEHLLDHGVDSIIRIGSQSKSERIKGHLLNEVVHEMSMTKSEKHENWEVGQAVRVSEKEITELVDRLASYDSPASIREYLRSAHETHHNELFGRDIGIGEDGYERVNGKIKNPVKRWVNGGRLTDQAVPEKVPGLQVLHSTRLESMSRLERMELYRNWLKNIREPIVTELTGLLKEHQVAREKRDTIRQELRHRCLQQAHIIGVTTTGLARELKLLRKLRTKVVVCEEAGEVLEAHLLTTLLPSVEQAILIGDHLQLRPQIQNYDLQSSNPAGVQYSLDTSLFERLVTPPHSDDIRLPFSTLDTQRRMHPSIAEMVRSTLYPTLTDGDNVKSYPDVVGMARRLFWLHHNELEAGAAAADPTSTSHSNDYEIQMSAALVSHLVKQGHYNPEDIAVLTPYLGQLHKLRYRMAAESSFAVSIDDRDLDELAALEEDGSGQQLQTKQQKISKTTLLKSVRLASVDNFQGEEAKVIIISLVRSNPQNKCGFLSTSNRINVLLSRAQHGCYLIGNADTYRHVPMWSQVIQLLRANGNFGTSLELKCPRHLETPLLVSRPDHFMTISPDGGCILPCEKRLDCGHACYGRCHSDLLHKAIKCHDKCPRPKSGCDHACPRECGEPCEPRCNVVLQNISLQLPCGHLQQSAKCWESQNPAAVRCQTLVDKTIPGCDHLIKMPCYIDVTLPNFKCEAECHENLTCGHTCRSPCHRCRPREDGKITKTNHGICQQICGRQYTACPHRCTLTCHGETKCRPCGQPCEVRCSHSRCSKYCFEPCAPCAEDDCASHCPHTKCTMPCAAPCDWVPCSKRCTLELACGHQCPALCGETCPDANYCQKCGSEDVLSMVVDYLLMGEYRDVDLDEDPCIFPDCGHFLTKSSMDGQMAMAEHYELDEDGCPTAIKGPLSPFSMDGVTVKSCPQCRGSLRSIARYGRIVRRAMLDESTKKFISWSNDQHLKLAERLLKEEQRLENDKLSASEEALRPAELVMKGHIPGQLSQLNKWVGQGRYKSSIKLYMDIWRYQCQVKAEEQPFQKVANFVKHANRNKATGNFRFDDSVIQVRGLLLATELLIKCNIMIVSDFLRLWSGGVSAHANISIDLRDNVKPCRELIRLAQETTRPQLEAAGHVYYAQFCGFTLALARSPPEETSEKTQPPGDLPGSSPPEIEPTNPSARDIFKTKGLDHLRQAKELMADRDWPSKQILETEIAAVETVLEGGVFYKSVTADEMRAVYAAMASEFRGTGHWYMCENGHPFTIGECGMPMEQARCPECAAPVGGQGHVPVAGVRQATEIENLARGVGDMRV